MNTKITRMTDEEQLALLIRKINTYRIGLDSYEIMIENNGKLPNYNGFILGAFRENNDGFVDRDPDWLIPFAKWFDVGDDIFVHVYNVERTVLRWIGYIAAGKASYGYDEEVAKCNRDGLKMVIDRLSVVLDKMMKKLKQIS